MDPRAVADLAKSGLVPEDMRVTIAGDNGITPPSGYTIPYFLPNGTIHPTMSRTRLFEPDSLGRRYLQPAGVAPYPYFCPNGDWRGAHARKMHYIIEGEKKAAAAYKLLGITGIGIGGCRNWAGPKTTKLLRSVDKSILAALPPASTVEVIFDGDYSTNKDVENGLAELCIALRAAGHTPVVVVLPEGDEKVGLDDWLVATHATLADFKALPRHDGNALREGRKSLVYRAKLAHNVNAEGEIARIIPNVDNTVKAMRLLPFYREHLWYNGFTHRIHVGEHPIDDASRVRIIADVQHRIDPNIGVPTINTAIEHVAKSEGFVRNPVVDKLNALVWDGEPRMDTFFENYFNAQLMPVEYLRAVSVNWLTALVARAYVPGCKVDNMLILEGKQGIGKSRALRAIGGEHYRENKVHDIGHKDVLQALKGSWIYDINELRGFKRSDHATIKALLSSDTDEFREAYRMDQASHKRTCVIVGSTNDMTYLSDDTGARRFWPIRCGYKVEVDLIARDIDQILAEAVLRYKSGADWWTMPETLSEEVTAARGMISEFNDQVGEAVEDALSLPRMMVDMTAYGKPKNVYAYVTMGMMYKLLQLDNSHINAQRATQISRALVGHGFEQYMARRSQLRAEDVDFSSTSKATRRSVYRIYLGTELEFGWTPAPPKVRSKLE